MLEWAYCSNHCNSFDSLKVNFKVFHSKSLQGDILICGQNGCPLDFHNLKALRIHINKKHGSVCNEPISSDQPGLSSVYSIPSQVTDTSSFIPGEFDVNNASFIMDVVGLDDLMSQVDSFGFSRMPHIFHRGWEAIAAYRSQLRVK